MLNFFRNKFAEIQDFQRVRDFRFAFDFSSSRRLPAPQEFCELGRTIMKGLDTVLTFRVRVS